MILDAIGDQGQIKRKYYQRVLPEDPSKDYYYIMRETPNTTALLIEYGFIDNLKNENSESNKIDKKQVEKDINEFLSLENPTRELIINLVEKIYIYQDKTIDIIFTFKNVT